MQHESEPSDKSPGYKQNPAEAGCNISWLQPALAFSPEIYFGALRD